jgi:F-type H+-transporting ATPase subunit b
MWWLVGGAHASGEEGAAGAGHEGAAGAGHEGAAHEGQAEGGHGGGHDEGIPFVKLGIQSASLLIFLGILFVIGARPVQDGLRKRAAEIRKSIDEAISQKKNAELRFAEIERKLAGLDRQVADMKVLAEQEAEQEAVRLREKAAQEAIRIQEVAERTIREESAKARRGLRDETIRLATELARQKAAVAINGEDQRRFAREFLDSIVSANAQNNLNPAGTSQKESA